MRHGLQHIYCVEKKNNIQVEAIFPPPHVVSHSSTCVAWFLDSTQLLGNILMSQRCCAEERGTLKQTQVTQSQTCGGGRRWTRPDVPQPPTGCGSQVAPGAMCSGLGGNLLPQLSSPSRRGQSQSYELLARWSAYGETSASASTRGSGGTFRNCQCPDLLESF